MPNIYNRQQKKEFRADKIAAAMSGTGQHIYQNNTSGDFILPKAISTNGTKMLRKDQKFQGDSYFMQFVRSGQLKLISTVTDSDSTGDTYVAPTPVMPIREHTMNENKLLLDQPEIVTTQGVVEHVQEKPKSKQKLNETKGFSQKKKEVLISEEPLSDLEIVRD